MRNFFVGYRGGAYSRPGLAFVGQCKQDGALNPPRDINFQYSVSIGYVLEFGEKYMRIKHNGSYITESDKVITGATNAIPCSLTSAGHGFSAGDWLYISGMEGLTGLNGLTWIVAAADTDHVTLTDLLGNYVDTTLWNAYTTGGTAARIYTLTTPYATDDLSYLKFSQSALSMTLCCVNQETGTEYPIYSLKRVGAANWTLTAVSFESSIDAPTGVTVTPHASTTTDTYYSYVVTAIDADTGQESIASSAGSAQNNDIAVYAGSNTISWASVDGASSYLIYKATPSYNSEVPVSSSYGYVGQSFGGAFTDTNITADFTSTPPIHQDPFARGAILSVNPTAVGTTYSQSTVGYTITTSTGSGAVILPIVYGAGVVSYVVQNGGKNYAATDTITITGGSSATADLVVGEDTGTYPSVPSYFQQRSVYANTLNNPDTYFMSKTGAYTNMDSSTPTIDNDAIIGTPWAQQVNGIQFLKPMTSGLIILNGGGSWLLNGGTTGGAVTPANQVATAQSYNGCSPTVEPLIIGPNLIYLQVKGSIIRELAYNFFTSVYTGTDITAFSAHLFQNHQIKQWAYAEEPFKIVWGVREDGILLSLTYLKEQEVCGFSRHDTDGQFVGICSASEPPVDAVYAIVKRKIGAKWYYYSERFNNRNWQTVEDCFCVDSGLSYTMSYPSATLTPSGVTGTISLSASAAVFTAANVGDVIRVGGGICDITSYLSSTTVLATVRQDITNTTPDDPDDTPLPVISGNWSISTPTNIIGGLNHLIGKEVSIFADGSVVPSQVVSDLGNGVIGVTLQHEASSITIGLPFVAQLQTLYLDPQGAQTTVQSRRKTVSSVSVRMEATRGISVGTNQPDSSTQPNGAIPLWDDMIEVKERDALTNAGDPIQLFTGDKFINVPSSWATEGQIAIEQTYPLPANILSVVSYVTFGDDPG